MIWEFGGEGNGRLLRVENIGENVKSFTFFERVIFKEMIN